MKTLLSTSLLLLFSLSVWASPQMDDLGPIPQNQSGDELSWLIYQQMDALLDGSQAGLKTSTNPFISLELPISGYTNQGFPIYDLSEVQSDWLGSQLMAPEVFLPWQPTMALPFTRAQYKGGELLASLHELVGTDGLETQMVLAADLVVQDGQGNTVLRVQDSAGGFHLPDWSVDERFLALSYGANRDESNGMRIYDLQSGTLVADMKAPTHFMVGAPTFAGQIAYVALDSWYSKDVVILAWDAQTGGIAYAEFTPEEFSYFNQFTAEGIEFADCDGEKAVVGLDFVRLEASL